jgi:PAS domain S-box-containing protein
MTNCQYQGASAWPIDERYAQLYEKIPVACIALDSSGVIRESNRAAAALLRTEASALAGQTLFHFAPTAQQALLRTHLAHVVQGLEGRAAVFALRVPGSIHPIVVEMKSALTGRDGAEVVSVLVDITARRRAEMVLEFLDSAGQALSTAATSAGVIEQIPSLAVPLLGDMCVVEFRDIADVIHHAAGHVDARASVRLSELGCAFFELPGIRRFAAAALSGAGPQFIEHIDDHVFRDGAPDPGVDRTEVAGLGSLLILPLEGRGSVFGVIAIGTVGQRLLAREDMPLALELARRASLAIDNGRLFSELYDANAAKDRFLAMLSHELRTPLTPVLAAVSAVTAKGTAEGQDVLALFTMIQRNIQLEARLIDDLLDLTRVSRGQFELAFDDVELHEVLRSVVAICQGDADRRGVTLIVEPRARRSRVRGDPTRLEQILWNLIKNAIKFTPALGRVIVRTYNSGDEIHVEVRDTGIGIEPERMARIFLPFVQADPSISRSFGGMGLGLSISKSLAEAHQGSIVVASDGPGRGSSFTLVLRSLRSLESTPPAKLEAARLHDVPPLRLTPRPIDSVPLRVLLVEDDPDTLAVTSMLLRGGHYEVTTAENLAEAMARMSEKEFDLLISDIALPDGSGLDLMRAMTSRKKAKGIALSGFGTQDDVRRAKLAGFAAHLTKPVSFARLEATIQQVTH